MLATIFQSLTKRRRVSKKIETTTGISAIFKRRREYTKKLQTNDKICVVY